MAKGKEENMPAVYISSRTSATCSRTNEKSASEKEAQQSFLLKKEKLASLLSSQSFRRTNHYSENSIQTSDSRGLLPHFRSFQLIALFFLSFLPLELASLRFSFSSLFALLSSSYPVKVPSLGSNVPLYTIFITWILMRPFYPSFVQSPVFTMNKTTRVCVSLNDKTWTFN